MRISLGANDEDILMLFMGWLYAFSGVKEVADELNSSNQFPNIKLLVLGKGDLWGYLESVANEHAGKKRIILVRWKSFKEVPKYILASDVCLLPALPVDIMMNIVPIKMYEYMAAGKPVIATRLPGLLKEFGQDNGVVYVNGPRDVLEAVSKLTREGSVRDLGAKARKFVEGNDWQKVVRDFEDCLEGVITCQRNPESSKWTAEGPRDTV
jgi:glycosyltransferase involved in cell wall biosynthesis